MIVKSFITGEGHTLSYKNAVLSFFARHHSHGILRHILLGYRVLVKIVHIHISQNIFITQQLQNNNGLSILAHVHIRLGFFIVGDEGEIGICIILQVGIRNCIFCINDVCLVQACSGSLEEGHMDIL